MFIRADFKVYYIGFELTNDSLLLGNFYSKTDEKVDSIKGIEPNACHFKTVFNITVSFYHD